MPPGGWLYVVPALFAGAVFLAVGGGALLEASQTDASGDGEPVFAPGADHAEAARRGLAPALEIAADGRSYELTLVGFSGSRVVVDELLAVKADPQRTYGVEIVSPLEGNLIPRDLRLRLWTGSSPPATDRSPGVCAVLDLAGMAGDRADGDCTGPASIQFIYEFRHDAVGTSTVSLRLVGAG